MIKMLNMNDRENAEAVLHLQKLSYNEEAKLINYNDLPPLKDTIQSIQESSETFYGYYIDEKLCGIIAIEIEEENLTICRLAVHPQYFRKGIARSLIKYIEKKTKANKIIVSTGTKNYPAVLFYEKNGFTKTKDLQINNELSITFFEKHLNRKIK